MGPDGLNLGGLPDDLDRIGTATPYRFDHGPAVLEAQRRWLVRTPNRFELLQEKTAGIRIAPSARIAPGARMIAPLEVGENTYIAGSATLGPNVVLGEGCRVEGETTIRDALVADGVRIKGPAEVDQAIVTPTGLLHAAYDVWLPADATGDLLGTSATAGAPLGITGLERLAALLTLAVGFLPVLTLRLLGRGQDFSHRVFPQLPSVVRGECALVGIADHPELPESIHASGWSETLRKAPRGVVRPRDAFAIADPEAAAWGRCALAVACRLEGAPAPAACVRSDRTHEPFHSPRHSRPADSRSNRPHRNLKRRSTPMTLQHDLEESAFIALPTEKSLDASNVQAFRTAIVPQLEQHDKVVLDLSNVEFIDSAGVGTLISCLRIVTERQGQLRLCGLNRAVRALFELMRMHRLFEVHPDRQSALNSLA
jgi:anti-sigma B factor antagonist